MVLGIIQQLGGWRSKSGVGGLKLGVEKVGRGKWKACDGDRSRRYDGFYPTDRSAGGNIWLDFAYRKPIVRNIKSSSLFWWFLDGTADTQAAEKNAHLVHRDTLLVSWP
jgi:hypothetical protein